MYSYQLARAIVPRSSTGTTRGASRASTALAKIAQAASTRHLQTSSALRNIPSWPSPPVPQGPVGPSDDLKPLKSKPASQESFWHQWTNSPSFQAAFTTVVGLAVVFGAGIGYLEWYKHHVLHRVSSNDMACTRRLLMSCTDWKSLRTGLCECLV